ncbi:MAG: iron uptake system component EfeO [Solirubrobacteraceae bacterium]|nr:iron uptake system component EfeO [Solirubrobacteraceae bacterium]
MLRRVALVAGAALALSSCGSQHHTATAPKTKAAPYSAINPSTNRAVAVSDAVYQGPISAYVKHVRRELGIMLTEVRAMHAAITAGDAGAARAAWLCAYFRYQTIGAAYGAFGDLDAAIDGLPGGLQGGTSSRQFTGMHRVELALWGRHSLRDAAAPAARLSRDVAKLRTSVDPADIEPLDYGLRAHEVLEDTLQLELAGRASPWASAALTALDGNITGTRVVMRTLAPLAAQTNRFSVALAYRALDRLDKAVQVLRRPGGFPRWDAVSQLQRERIDGLTAAAAERLSYIPSLVSPLKPRPALRPVEVTDR